MHIWWQQTTWVTLVPRTTHVPRFVIVAHIELWIFAFVVIAYQNKYANELFNMHIWWQQTTWVKLVPSTTHIPSLVTVAHIELWMFAFVVKAYQNMQTSYFICAFGCDRPHGWHLFLALPIHQVSSLQLTLNSKYLPSLLLANQNKYANNYLIWALGYDTSHG